MRDDGSDPASPAGPEEVARLLQQLSDGEESAASRLLPLIYDDLRRIARRYLRGERSDHSLQSGDLLHEAFLRLAGGASRNAARDRIHFLALAARAMRQVLVEHARRRNAGKRLGGAARVTLDDTLGIVSPGPRPLDILDVDAALGRLSRLHERQARVVELRFFSGMTIAETATALGVHPDTVVSDWSIARVWLSRELTPRPG